MSTNLIKKGINTKYGYLSFGNGWESLVQTLNENQDFFTANYILLKSGTTINVKSYPYNEFSLILNEIAIHIYDTNKQWIRCISRTASSYLAELNIEYRAESDCYIRFSMRGYRDFEHRAYEYPADYTPRLEKFIYAICSMEVSDLPAPLSRIEILWNCLITGETPDFEPQSRNEQYLMAMLGLYDLENLPTPMSRGEKLLYKIAMGETDLSDIPAYLSRYEELLGYLAENGGVGDFEYILQTLNQRLSTLYSTKERPMKQAVIKGDTLVNELPRPSLKNTMTNAASQKLNQGYDINPRTLTNLKTGHVLTDVNNVKTTYENDIYTYQAKDGFNGNIFPSNMVIFNTENSLESDTTYTMIFKYLDDYNVTFAISGLSSINTHIELNRETSSTNNEIRKIAFTISSNNSTYNKPALRIHNISPNNIRSIRFKDVMILKGDYTQEDIPYFEGTKTFSATPNVVDGEFKSAILKGNTLVNLMVDHQEEKIVDYGNPPETPNVANMTMLKPNTEYTLFYKAKYQNVGDVGKLFFRFAIDGSTISDMSVDGTNPYTTTYQQYVHKFTTPSTIDYFIFRSNGHYFLVKECVLLEGDYTNVDIPYFTGMSSVKMPVLTTTGKNLFDEKQVPEQLSWGNNVKKANVKENTTYVYSSSPYTGYVSIKFYDNNDNEIKQGISINSGTSFTTPPNTSYLKCHTDNDSLVQFEEGSTSTPYEPFKSNILSTSEEVVLGAIGDIKDELDLTTGQLIENTFEITFDGSEDWKMYTYEGQSTKRFRLVLKHRTLGNEKLAVVCDKIMATPNNQWNQDKELIEADGTLVSIRKNINTLKEFTDWLKDNNVSCRFLKAQPTIKTVNTTITDQDGATQTKLHSFNDGYLSVSSQGLLPSAVNYEVPTNNSYYLPDMLTLGAQYTSRGSADCHATIDGKLLALGKNRTFTTPSSITNRLMVLDAPVDDLMFIKGDHTAKDFGYFEGMKSVGLSNKMPVLTTNGKNLFNNNYTIGKFIDEMGIDSDGENTRCALTEFMPIKGGANVKFSNSITVHGVMIFEYDANKKFLAKTWADQLRTTQDNTRYYRYRANLIGMGSSSEEALKVMMMEYGTQATSYEPYKTNILTVNEDVTLRGIGDVQDTLDGLTGEVTERMREIVLDETNVGGIAIHQPSNSELLTFRLDNVANDGVIDAQSMSDKLSWNNTSGLLNCPYSFRLALYGNPAATRLFICLPKSALKEETSNGLKEWLSNNPVKIQYPLATESTKTVDLTTVDQDDQPTKLKTFNDISHVEINSDNLIPSVNLEVATKISETLSNMGPQQLDISNTQNELGQTIDEQTENTDATMMATTEIYENL